MSQAAAPLGLSGEDRAELARWLHDGPVMRAEREPWWRRWVAMDGCPSFPCLVALGGEEQMFSHPSLPEALRSVKRRLLPGLRAEPARSLHRWFSREGRVHPRNASTGLSAPSYCNQSVSGLNHSSVISSMFKQGGRLLRAWTRGQDICRTLHHRRVSVTKPGLDCVLAEF